MQRDTDTPIPKIVVAVEATCSPNSELAKDVGNIMNIIYAPFLINIYFIIYHALQQLVIWSYNTNTYIQNTIPFTPTKG